MDVPRVQIKLRGQRFESAKETLLQQSGFFARFFQGRVENHPDEGEAGTDGPLELSEGTVQFTYERKGAGAPIEGGGGLGVSTARDLFDFGPMSNEFFGGIVASMRKGKPTFKWTELGFEQQKTMSEHVRIFDIYMLRDLCKAPTAPPPVIRGDSDDDLEMPECGCEYCGTTEHATAVCPRKDNIMLAAQTIAIANAKEAGQEPPAGCEMALARAAERAAAADAAEAKAQEEREVAEAEAATAEGRTLPEDAAEASAAA